MWFWSVGINVNQEPDQHAKDVDAQQQVPQPASVPEQPDGGQIEAMKHEEAPLPDQDVDHLQDRQEVSPVQPRDQEVISSDQGVGEVVDPAKTQTHREDPEQVETFFSTMSHRYDDPLPLTCHEDVIRAYCAFNTWCLKVKIVELHTSILKQSVFLHKPTLKYDLIFS